MNKGLSKRLLIILSCISICILIGFITSAFADVIKLKNGRSIGGRIKEITDKEVFLEINVGKTQGTVWFRYEEIESINNLSLEEAKAKLSTKDAFTSGDKEKIIASSAQEGQNFVSNTRKLEFKHKPEIEVASKDKIKEYLKKEIEKNYSQEKLEIRQKLLVKLGLIPKTYNYSKEILDMLGEQVGGYYNPEDKKIYINETALGPITPGLPSITVMHEQVHALQDQHYDLKSILEAPLAEDDDRALAIQSVVEGEATVLMFDAFLRSMGAQDKTAKAFDLRSFVIDSLLAYSKRFKTESGEAALFVEDLLFPYVWGGSFIQHLVNTKGWEAVDSIYKDMPSSSEQIMHPEKYYIMRDNPKYIAFPGIANVLGNTWVRLSKNTLGEYGFYLVGKKFLDELSNKIMSEGWGGDAYELYEMPNSRRTLFISLSKWDNEQDANELFDFYKKIIGKKYREATLIKEDGSSSQWKTEEDNVYISKAKNSVLIIEGAPDEDLTKLKENLAI